MSKVSKLLYVAAVSLAVAACGGSEESPATNTEERAIAKATVEGKIAAAPSSEVVFGLMADYQMLLVDTLRTSADSSYKFEIDLLEGDPEFVYMVREGQNVASLILNAGDVVNVDVDAEGNAVISGSEESVKFTQVQKEHAQMDAHFSEMMAELEAATSDSKRQSLARKISKEYVSYNIQSRKYVVENSRSLSVISVLYRQLGDLPVFSELTDALLFDSTADSLQKAYPDSRYAMAIRVAADQKLSEMELQNMIDQTEPIGYFDVELPDAEGQVKKLSDLDAKVILLYFWSASQPVQNIFNIENLKPIYESYHKKGFDIFQVSLDNDKVMWANAVKGQELPWINVCDIRGGASPYISMYNLQALPSAFLISNGELVDGEIVDEASFRKLIEKLLK